MSAAMDFLSSVIREGAGSQLLGVDERYFTEGGNDSVVYTFARDYYRNHREVPNPQLVREETGVRLPTVNGAVAYYLDGLRDQFEFNIIRDHWEDLRGAVQGGEAEPVVSAMEAALRAVRRERRGANMSDLGDGLEMVYQRLERAQMYGALSGIPSPWYSFNEQTAGMQRGDLITFVGRMGMGKTAMLLALADAAWQDGNSVLVVTTEMPTEQLARRWAAMNMGIDPQNLKRGTLSTYAMRRFRSGIDNLLGRERLRMLSLGTNATLDPVEAAIDEFSPDAIYIDGAYFLRPRGRSVQMRTMTERVSTTQEEIKQLTIDVDRPIVQTMQLNRTAGKGGKDASLENIGMSDAIGMNSSIVVAVKNGPTENPFQSRELEFLKGREGEHGSFAINFKFKPVNFTEIPQEELEQHQAGEQTLNAIGAENNWT